MRCWVSVAGTKTLCQLLFKEMYSCFPGRVKIWSCPAWSQLSLQFLRLSREVPHLQHQCIPTLNSTTVVPKHTHTHMHTQIHIWKGSAFHLLNARKPLLWCPENESVSCSVMSDFLWPHGLWLARLLCPQDSPGKNPGVGSHSLLQGVVPNQGLNPCLPQYRQILYCLSHQGSPLP